MDIEKTIQFLVENAAAHDARLATIEKAVLGLTEHQVFLQSSLEGTQKVLRQLGEETDRRFREMGEKTDARIAALVSAIAKLIERPANGTSQH